MLSWHRQVLKCRSWRPLVPRETCMAVMSPSFMPISTPATPTMSVVPLGFHPQPLFAARPLHLSCCRFNNENNEENKANEGYVKKFKRMLKDYWYILVPVHCVTSCFWYGGFFFMCKFGVDMVAFLQFFYVPEYYLEKLRNSDVGYFALAYACYKLATPARYTVTVTGTAFAIRYLNQKGVLKTTTQVASGIKKRRDDFRDKLEDDWIKSWKRFAQKRPPKDKSKKDS